MARPRTVDIPKGVGPVEKGAVADLRRLKVKTKAPALAETALKLARTIDKTTAARDLAALSREFRTVMAELSVLASDGPQEVSASDDLAGRREQRLAAAALDVLAAAAAGRSATPDR